MTAREDGRAELERRYRRLLRWYPAEHRRAYGEEMLGVMLAGARDGQRRPGRHETADVLLAAVRMRLGRLVPGLRDDRWADAAAVFGTLAPMLLFAYWARKVAAEYSLWLWLRVAGLDPDRALNLPPSVWASALAWLVVTVAALVGWRYAAAAVAWAAVLGDVLALGSRYLSDPVGVLSALWILVLAMTAAAALCVPGVAARRRSVLGRRQVALFAVACLLGAVSAGATPLLNLALGRESPRLGGWYLPGLVPGGPMVSDTGPATALLVVAAAVLASLAVARIGGPVRRRLLALVAPAAVLVLVIAEFFHGYAVSSARFTPPVLMVPGQWIVLAAVPPVVFLLAVALVNRRDRRLHLIELGRAAERRSAD